jgi:hypothetical protein
MNARQAFMNLRHYMVSPLSEVTASEVVIAQLHTLRAWRDTAYEYKGKSPADGLAYTLLSAMVEVNIPPSQWNEYPEDTIHVLRAVIKRIATWIDAPLCGPRMNAFRPSVYIDGQWRNGEDYLL